MNEVPELESLLSAGGKRMSKGQRAIAAYLRKDLDKAAFMTAQKLGEMTQVSESTVVRFAAWLGFAGYPEFQDALQEIVRRKLTPVQRMELSEKAQDPESLVQSVVKSDIANLRSTLETLDMDEFRAISDALYSARRIFILGIRSSAPLAQFAGYYLSFLHPDVRIVTSGFNDVLEQIFHIGEGDVLMAISFPRYSRRIVEGMRYASERKATCIAITDAPTSPLVDEADHCLFARSGMAAFADSLVAPMSLLNALVAAMGMRAHQETSESFRRLEDIWSRYRVYTEKDGQE